MSQETKAKLLETLFTLREAQSNCSANERASYEPAIAAILDQINKG